MSDMDTTNFNGHYKPGTKTTTGEPSPIAQGEVDLVKRVVPIIDPVALTQENERLKKQVAYLTNTADSYSNDNRNLKDALEKMTNANATHIREITKLKAEREQEIDEAVKKALELDEDQRGSCT